MFNNYSKLIFKNTQYIDNKESIIINKTFKANILLQETKCININFKMDDNNEEFIIDLNNKSILWIRNNKQKILFKNQEITKVEYGLEYGNIQLDLFTNSIKINNTMHGGSVVIKYKLIQNKQLIADYKLKLLYL